MSFRPSKGAQSQWIRRHITEYKQIAKDPDCWWFKIYPKDDYTPGADGPNGYVCKWDIEIEGFSGTIYEGYILTAEMLFPSDYPLSPPRVLFTTKMYHPNIYDDGRVCISILHTAQTDPHTDEHATEQWSPVQSVRTILLSIMLMLSEPNTNSPANLDASIHYRNSKEAYEEYVKTKILSQCKVSAGVNGEKKDSQ